MSQDSAGAGPFERNGLAPDLRVITKIARADSLRAVLEYLAERGYLREGLDWYAMGEDDRETWATAIEVVYRQADREARKAAMDEVRARAALALDLVCRKCGAAEGYACWDLRTNFQRCNNYPHHERMDDVPGQEA